MPMRLHEYLNQLPSGGRARFARTIGVSHAYLYQMTAGIRQVPAVRVLPIVRATNGEVTPHDLRPDIYPDPGWLPPDVVDAPPKHN